MDTLAQSGTPGGQTPPKPKPADAAANPLFHIHKPGQGEYVRWGTAAGAGVLAVACANFVYSQLGAFAALALGADPARQLVISTIGAALLLVVLGFVIFRYVAQHHGVVDFLIATEGEMKKVNWSTRREVIGATRVVIFVMFAMAIMLFVADLVFMAFFGAIGVLKLDLLGRLFGAGQ
jgi:preprotein translocase SecE subunit